MKHVLYLRTDLGTQDLTSGGSVAHTLGVLDGLHEHGSVVYCASSAMQSVLAQKSEINFKALWLPRVCSFFGFKLSCLFSNIWFFFQLIVYLSAVQVDSVYQRYSMLNIVGLMIARFKRIPLILEFNGSEAWVDANWSGRKKKRMSWFVMYIEDWNVQSADYIIVVSRVLKDMLIARGVAGEKILVNPNGVDVERFDPEWHQHDAQRVRATLGITPRYVFGFIGSFSYWHGIEVISAMIPRVVQCDARAHFLLIGSGPLLAQLRAAVEDAGRAHAVTFLGNVAYEDAPIYLSACDAFLCPSQPNADGTPFFGSPTKLFEYMSMGKPIIASNVDQLCDIVEPSFGYLLSPDNVDGFVDAACDLMRQDMAVQKSMGHYAREAAIRKFSWAQHVSHIQQFVS